MWMLLIHTLAIIISHVFYSCFLPNYCSHIDKKQVNYLNIGMCITCLSCDNDAVVSLLVFFVPKMLSVFYVCCI